MKRLKPESSRRPWLGLVLVLATGFVQADDFIYSHCVLQDPASESGRVDLLILAYNLSTAEEGLYIRPQDNSMERLGGRRAGEGNLFSVDGDLAQLRRAEALRDSAAQAPFYWTRSEGIETLTFSGQSPTCEPGPTLSDSR